MSEQLSILSRSLMFASSKLLALSLPTDFINYTQTDRQTDIDRKRCDRENNHHHHHHHHHIEHLQFRTAVTVHRCLNGLAPAYLTELCTPVTQSRSSCRLRSSYRNRLAVPSVKLTLGSRSFSVSGPTVWNALPDYLRNPTLSIDVFKRYLKTFLFAQY